MRTMLGIFSVVLPLVAIASQAQAAAITNLADVPVTIGMYTDKGLEPFTIEAGRTYRVEGDLRVSVKGRDYFIEYSQEYAIWKNGDFGPQRDTRFESRFK